MIGQKRKQENLMPTIDEGWWSSVLAEESHFLTHPYHLTESRPEAGAEYRRNIHDAEKNSSVESRVAVFTDVDKMPVVDWEQVKELYQRDQIIALTVSGHNRGGLLVEGEGLHGFVPFSHLIDLAGKAENVDRDQDLETYTGRLLRLKVIECVPEDGRVVLSERAAQSESGKREELFHALQPGQRLTGVVTNVTDFGVFVDLGGVEGLIHISELSWGRVKHPTQIVSVGSTIEVYVLELAPERCRVALSLKRLLPNPWQNATSEFPEGCVRSATITSILSFGAFAKLDAGVEGLIHASEIPQADGKPVKEILCEGQTVQVRILHLDSAHQRLGLSMRLE